MAQQAFKMMDLDHRLAADTSGAQRQKYEAVLAEARQRVAAKLDSGVTAVDHEKLSLAKSALEAGQELLPKLWQAQHR